MATKRPRTVLYRRRREGKTDYSKRLKLLIARKPRLIVRLTNRKIIAQLIEFNPQGDKVLIAVDSSALKKEGWNHSFKNLPAAYLTGLLIGKKVIEKNIPGTILDSGFKSVLKKSILTAFLKGVVDAGVNIPHGDEDIFPDENRLTGKHIQNNDKIVEDFNKIKDKLMK
ncbi:50S ribosomal protein L18 [Candidatus Woesearchaeota archaeon]|jgi:large subunit ribosomal protein L18|nr:50S ribosomal protein L18 [Candidatus Woesearchaeota archaeon]